MDKAGGGAFPLREVWTISVSAVLTRITEKPKPKKQGNSMSKRKPCPICGAVHNYALRRVIVRLEQALSRAAPQMEEWYLVGYEFLRKHYLTWEGENPAFTDRIARSIGAAQMALRGALIAAVPPTVRDARRHRALDGSESLSRCELHSAPIMNGDKKVSFTPHGGDHDDRGCRSRASIPLPGDVRRIHRVGRKR